jgi:hypothetical protein
MAEELWQIGFAPAIPVIRLHRAGPLGMKNIQGRAPWFIAISVVILSIAAIWSFAATHGHKQAMGLRWPALTSAKWTRLFVQLRGLQKHSIFIGCDRADCTELATSLIQMFERVGWSVGFGDAEDYSAGGIVIDSCLDEGAELWDMIKAKTSLHPVLVCSSHSTSPQRTKLVIGIRSPP